MCRPATSLVVKGTKPCNSLDVLERVETNLCACLLSSWRRVKAGLLSGFGPLRLGGWPSSKAISISLTDHHSVHHTPLVCFFSLLKFLRKLSWLNGLAESFCGEELLSAVNRHQQDVGVMIEAC